MQQQNMNKAKMIKGVIIIGLAIVIIVSIALIIINQGIIVNEAYNYCTTKVYKGITISLLEECLRVYSLKAAVILIPSVILIVISSVIIMGLIGRQLTSKKLKKHLMEIKEENELMASPFSAALMTRTLLGVPFHVWELGFTVGFIIGSVVGVGLLRSVCIIMSFWCGIGAYIDYRKFKEVWR